MLNFFSIFLFSIVPIYSYNHYLEPPVFNSLCGDNNVQLNAGFNDSILVTDFYPFINRINKCERSIDHEHAVATSFQKQTLFGDAVLPTYDYLTSSTDEILHNISMSVCGNFNGRIMKIPILI